jgi:serine/threonine-protein kinase
VGTLLYLADCYERIGRLASAWAIFREAGSAARAAGQAERTQVAYERAQRLAPTLSKLALMVATENRVDGFELLINDKRLVPALFGVPFPVDAGRYQLIARAPGRSTWTTQIEVQGGNDQRVVQIPALPLVPAAAAPLPAAPLPVGAPGTNPLGANPAGAATTGNAMSGGPSPSSAAAPLGSESGGSIALSAQQTAGLIVAGGGALAIGVGVLFGVNAKNEDDEAKAGCPSTCLTREAAALNEDARTSALIANVSYGVGLAAIATGAVLFFTGGEAPPAPSPSTALKVSTELGAERRMLTVSGAF